MLVGRGFAAAQPNDSSPVEVSVIADRAAAHPGDQMVLAVVINHAERWHVHTNDPKPPSSWEGFVAIPTTIKMSSVSGVRFGPIQWPTAHEIALDLGGTGKPEPYGVFEGRAVVFVPLVIAPDAKPGAAPIELIVSFQACDDSVCIQPEDRSFKIALEVVAVGGASSPPSTDPVFAGFDGSIFGRFVEVRETWEFDAIGAKFRIAKDAYWLIMLIAFAAGLLLNLTPCVLPVIPIKILSMQQQAGSPRKLALFGTVYCVGIVAMFLVLGLLIFGLVTGGKKQDWGQIFTSAWFVVVMAAIVGVMGAGMMSRFTIRLPQSVSMFNPSHDTIHGNFLLGVLTALLSTPCTGPLLGATIAWSATQPAWLGLATFVVMGIGMAAPYALLMAFPKLVDRMPRSGPGGELLKQVLGIFLIAVAVFLAANLTPARWPWWLIGAVAAAAFLWAIVGGWRMLRSRTAKLWVTALSVACLAGIVIATPALADEGPLPWKRFYSRPSAEIRASIQGGLNRGDTVVVDFTAKWCTNCHVIEKTILNSEEGQRLLTAPGVSIVKVDLTQADQDEGWDLVKEISGGGGIPLLAVFRPGEPKPVFFNSFFKISDLARAMDAAPAAHR